MTAPVVAPATATHAAMHCLKRGSASVTEINFKLHMLARFHVQPHSGTCWQHNLQY
jgi:hypothetical protein